MSREREIHETMLVTASNTLAKAVEVIKREDKWDAVEYLNELMWKTLDELEELRGL